MKFFKLLIVIITILALLMPIICVSYAADSSMYNKFLNKKSELQAQFKTEFDNLVKEGYGKKSYDPDKELPIPDVESPKESGIDAYTYFISVYGDMAGDPDRQMEYIDNMPDDEFFEIMGGVGKKLKIHSLSSQDALMKLMDKKLNTGILYNLESKYGEMEEVYDVLTKEEAKNEALSESIENAEIIGKRNSSAYKTVQDKNGNWYFEILSPTEQIKQSQAKEYKKNTLNVPSPKNYSYKESGKWEEFDKIEEAQQSPLKNPLSISDMLK